MINIYTVSIHPSFLEEYFSFGVGSRARKLGIKIENINLRDFAVDDHASVDSPPYSEEDGMVLRPEPLVDAVRFIQGDRTKKPYVIYTAAYGTFWSEKIAKRFSSSISQGKLDYSNSVLSSSRDQEGYSDQIVFICGRFSGVDQRFIDKYVDEIFSVGDFILSGGELPILTMIDSILRYIPGVLGNSLSPYNESFESGMNGNIEYPLYSRPQEFEGMRVPEVLLSGDHKKIREWKKKMSEFMTKNFRPDLLKKKDKD